MINNPCYVLICSIHWFNDSTNLKDLSSEWPRSGFKHNKNLMMKFATFCLILNLVEIFCIAVKICHNVSANNKYGFHVIAVPTQLSDDVKIKAIPLTVDTIEITFSQWNIHMIGLAPPTRWVCRLKNHVTHHFIKKHLNRMLATVKLFNWSNTQVNRGGFQCSNHNNSNYK